MSSKKKYRIKALVGPGETEEFWAKEMPLWEWDDSMGVDFLQILDNLLNVSYLRKMCDLLIDVGSSEIFYKNVLEKNKRFSMIYKQYMSLCLLCIQQGHFYPSIKKPCLVYIDGYQDLRTGRYNKFSFITEDFNYPFVYNSYKEIYEVEDDDKLESENVSTPHAESVSVPDETPQMDLKNKNINKKKAVARGRKKPLPASDDAANDRIARLRAEVKKKPVLTL